MDKDAKMRSLNEVLKWSVEQSTKDGRDAGSVNKEFVEQNREVIDHLFRDQYEDIEAGRRIVAAPESSDAQVAEALEAMEEFAQDLNYATNFGKVGVLKAAIDRFNQSQDELVRVNAVWLLGSSMQDVESVKDDVAALGGLDVLRIALSAADSAKLRAKGVMASSALLRNSAKFETPFRENGGIDALVGCLVDADLRPRDRALFFLEHSRATGCAYLADQVSADSKLVEQLLSLATEDASEPAARALAGGVVVSPEGKANLLKLGADQRLAELAKQTSDLDLKRALLQIVLALKS